VAKDTLELVDKVQAEAATIAASRGGSPASQSAPAGVEMDKPVAAFSLPNYDGKTVEVGAWKRNKATVIMFIATKCPFSNAYNMRMANMAKAYGKKGVRFVGINANVAELAPEVASHAREHKFSFPVLKDTGNVIADRFAAKVTPEVFVVDSSGVLRYHGRIDNDKDEKAVVTQDLKNALDAVLGNKPVTTKMAPAFGCSIKRV
jgi:thiol-disulfide isomerase/thioredoxin